MHFFRFNRPSDVTWYANLLDVMMLALFAVVVGAVVQGWRRGRRDYAILVVAAPIYGMLLELGGMLTHNSYTQGAFVMMLDFPTLRPFADSTAMPSYVPIFYPTFLFFGYKLVEPFGIVRPWRRAVAGGCMMGLLDCAYIIQGGLPHVVWWTWHPWEMYQLWLGWPLLDLWWEMTWHAFLFWLVYRVTPRVDRWYEEQPDRRVANAVKTLLVVPLALSVLVLAVGPILHLPPGYVTSHGGRQWPIVSLMVVAFTLIFVTADKQPSGRLDGVVATMAAIYVACMAPMVVGNVIHEGTVTAYVAVQTAALVVLASVVACPVLTGRTRRDAIDGRHAGDRDWRVASA